jgi:hypothetical protein
LNTSKTIIISLFLSVILVTGAIALSFSSSFMINAQAQPSYSNNNYKLKDTNVNLNKLKCINDNININGVNSGDVNVDNKDVAEGNLGAYSFDGSEGYYNDYKKAVDCSVSNKNTNTNIVSTSGGGNQTVLPEPATLTVKKQIFGCNNIIPSGANLIMDCPFQNNSTAPWLNCNNNINPDFNRFCQSLPESIFDIEVLDDQSTLQEFAGSEQGTTIQNLEPGTYTVNEIKNIGFFNQLGGEPFVEGGCRGLGFPDGGRLDNTTVTISYNICFEYEDEQGGNDCSTITLAAGEERTCIVKNYIRAAADT